MNRFRTAARLRNATAIMHASGVTHFQDGTLPGGRHSVPLWLSVKNQAITVLKTRLVQ